MSGHPIGDQHERRLAIFTNIPNPYNHYLYDGLRREGWDLRVVYKGDPQSAGRAWSIEPGPHDVITGSIRDEHRELRRCRGDRRHVILTGSYAGLIEAERRALLSGASCQVLFWGERLGAPRPLSAAVRKLYFTGFDAILAVGTWAVAGYRAVTRASPIHVFPYTTAGPGPSERQPATTPVVGFVGDLIERKGVDVLIEAVARLPDAARPALEIAGQGVAGDELRQLARRLDVAVEWPGHVTVDELHALRQRWWAQAVPSRYDGWGVVVAEALAAGVPVVASSHVGAAVDLVRRGVNGTIVSDVEDWSAALGRYTDADVVRREGRRARLVGEAFSADAAAAWLSRLLLDGARTRPPRSFVADAWRSLEGKLDDF